MATPKPAILLVASAVVLAGAATGAGFALSGATGHRARGGGATLSGSSCSGPPGAAYVADPGYQGFTAVDTANCQVVQTSTWTTCKCPATPVTPTTPGPTPASP